MRSAQLPAVRALHVVAADLRTLDTLNLAFRPDPGRTRPTLLRGPYGGRVPGPLWPRSAGRGPVVALGKLVADQVLSLSGPLVVGAQQRVVRTTTAGGAPANVTANLARLDLPARFAGWAGADPLAEGLLADLSARGVEIAVVRRGRTPVSTVLVHPDGERTLLSDGGEGELAPSDVLREWVADAAVLHLDGYDLLRYPEALRAAAALARDAGVPV